MYRQAGTTPNFTDIARRYGYEIHTVWLGTEGWRPGGGRAQVPPERADRQEVIEAAQQLPGATKRGIYEYLIDRPPLRRRAAGLQHAHHGCAATASSAGAFRGPLEPPPRFETAPGEQMARSKESPGMADAEGEVFIQRVRGHAGLLLAPPVRLLQTRTEDDVMACWR